MPSAGVESFAGPRGLAPKVSIIIVNHNGRQHLEACLTSVLNQTYPDYEVILVDSGSTDRSAEYVEQRFGQVRLVRAGENVGFGCANNLGGRLAAGEYLAFLNPDTVVEPDWLQPLVRTLQRHPAAGLATAKILLCSQPDRINTCGNQVHLTGIPSCRGYMLPADSLDQLDEVCSVSGAAFVIHRRVFEQIGGFDTGFFLYAEDNDLSWRALLAGYRCLYVPDSVVYHDYAPRFGPDKYLYLERNRYQLLLRNLRRRTLLLLAPALVLAELVTWGYAWVRGRAHLRAKLGSYGWLLANWPAIRRGRRRIQARRQAPDREILRRCSHALAYDLAGQGRTARLGRILFDPLFGVWHCICSKVIFW